MNIECVLIPVLILSEPALHEQQFQVLGRETRPETVVVGRCDIACLLTHHYGQGIGLLADTLGRRMQEAAFILLPAMIMAPSCKGLFLKKMFSMSL